MIDYGFNQFWPTTVLLDKIENKSILESATNVILSNFNIEQPPNDFENFDVLRDCAELHTFRDEVVIPSFEKYLLKVFNVDINNVNFSLRSWLAGAKSGYMIPVHNHSGASVSAIFYISCEDKNCGGQLTMIDPRSNANRGYVNSFKHVFESKIYQPKTGEYLMFPSFLYHHALPFTGDLRLAMPVDFFVLE